MHTHIEWQHLVPETQYLRKWPTELALSLGHSSQSANTRLHKQRFITGPGTFSVCLFFAPRASQTESKFKFPSRTQKERMHSLSTEEERLAGQARPVGVWKINKPTGKSPCHWGPKWKQCKAQQFSVFSLQFSVTQRGSLSTFVKILRGNSRQRAGAEGAERAVGSAALSGTSVSRIVVVSGGWGEGFGVLGSGIWYLPLAAGRKTRTLG